MNLNNTFWCVMLIFWSYLLPAQSYDVFTVVGSNLLIINPTDASIVETLPINNLPNGEAIRSLTYSTSDGNMYGMIRLTTTPTLVKLAPDGTLTIIGNLSVPNETVFLAEGLAYNEADNKLYAAVSLNGGTADNDFFSETLVEINPATAEASIFAQISFPSGTPDVDNMTFSDNVLIVHDGLPGDDENRFYLIDFQNVSAGVANATLGFATSPYQPVGDIEKLNCSNTLLLVHEFDVLRLDIEREEVTLIGSTHSMSQFGGAFLTALTDAPGNRVIPLSILQDTTACEGEQIALSAQEQGLEVDWSTGERGTSLSVSETGTYFGTVLINGCEVPTDTIDITFENCEDCEDLRSTIETSLKLGSDTIVCTGSTLALSIDVEGAEVVWNTGFAGPTLEVRQEGMHWARVLLDGCTFQTDTINVQFNSCDGCDALELELSDHLQLRNDTIICVNDTIPLTLDIPGADIEWNTGQTGPGININVPGPYWASVNIGGCVFQSDTLQLGVRDCLECDIFIPNVFSPDGNGVNDQFEVFVDEATCSLQEIEIFIFNRWGGLIFEGRQNRWDGKVNREPAKSDVYLYLVKMTLLREGNIIEVQKSGDVMLLTNE